ncbi:hypothetical protein JTE90_021647 [Oedothorax gibbosus]|uniref:Uncharacterized protein n=1 Tax=Oedothorax gibbosus TaxID=931172 RepID=A0AAV6VRK7_9ARAC|nr:hypothetical protein JTE90_021647 [Oedothorax gibbosus]
MTEKFLLTLLFFNVTYFASLFVITQLKVKPMPMNSLEHFVEPFRKKVSSKAARDVHDILNLGDPDSQRCQLCQTKAVKQLADGAHSFSGASTLPHALGLR